MMTNDFEFIYKRLDKMDANFELKLDSVQSKLENKIDETNIKIREIDKRLIPMELYLDNAKTLRVSFFWPLAAAIVGGTIVGFIITVLF